MAEPLVATSVFDRLLKDRIIWLGSEVRDENANEICAKILLLAAEDPEKDIYLYVNSPGGSITAGMAIYDTMQFVPNDIVTVGIGMAASMGQLLLTSGTKGKRYITPNARVLLHQPHGGFGGTAFNGVQAPGSRYILPSFEERTAYGYKRQDPYAKLFEDRIIFLGVQVDDASADDIMAQLLVLESMDPDRDIILYINSPGGSFTAMTAIYDTMQYIRPQIQTVVLGQAASAAAVIASAGTPGKRLALPNARVLIHQPAMGEAGHGQASDIEIQAAEIMRMRSWLEETLSRHSNRTQEQVNTDIDRDKILSADEALEYGLIDQVLTSRKSLPALTR